MNRRKILIHLAALCAAASVGSVAIAHDDAYLDTLTAPNGGQLRMAGIYHFELVVDRSSPEPAEKPVVVYVTDHAGTKIPVAGASATAIILANKVKTTVKLAPDGDNRLKGTGRYASTPDMKVVVSVTLAGKPVEQARFTPQPLALSNGAQNGHSH